MRTCRVSVVSPDLLQKVVVSIVSEALKSSSVCSVGSTTTTKQKVITIVEEIRDGKVVSTSSSTVRKAL